MKEHTEGNNIVVTVEKSEPDGYGTAKRNRRREQRDKLKAELEGR
jgi:hypothetical protein